MIKQTLYQHILIKRVLFVFIVLRRLNELFSKKEFEHKAEIFTYDPAGNRLTGPKDKLNYTYNEGNQLSELAKVPLNKGGKGVVEDEQEKKTEYTYDKNGNLTKRIELDDEGQIKKTTLYTYDYENRLIKVEIQKKDKLKIVAFTYDPFGRRLSKSVSHLSSQGETEAILEQKFRVILDRECQITNLHIARILEILYQVH